MAKNNSRLQLKDNKCIALVYRGGKPEAVALSKKLAAWLKERNYQVFTAPDQKLVPGTKATKGSKDLSKMGLVIVLGGDGTYLRAVRLLEGAQIPILGFNMGSLGFLTAHQADEIFSIVEETLSGKMQMKPRSMLQAEVIRKGKSRGTYHALNDVVIERGSLSQLINTAIYADKFLVAEVKADGLVIASPSGSTAYNLAAGGPILHPEVRAIVVTPVAPHSLTSRPMIFPDHGELEFKLEGQTQKAHFVIDGQKVTELTADDEVQIRRSCYDHWILRSPNHNFFHLLREKLKFGDRS